jgi:hypothetical protein
MVEHSMDLGPSEIMVILVVMGVTALILYVMTLVVRRLPAPRYTIPDQRRPLPPEAVSHLQHLLAGRQKIQAIKEIRALTGLGLKEAKDLADAIEAGNYHPATTPLSDRVRAFESAGDHASALALVRAETGMTTTEAERFIQALTT